MLAIHNSQVPKWAFVVKTSPFESLQRALEKYASFNKLIKASMLTFDRRNIYNITIIPNDTVDVLEQF